MVIYLFESEYGASQVFDPSTLTEEEKARAVIVNKLPQPEEREGYYAQVFCSFDTGEVWYEYFEIIEDEDDYDW